jgi:hypothetical protein
MKGKNMAGFYRFPAILMIILMFSTGAWGGDWSISLWGGSPFYIYPAPPPRYPVYGPAMDYDYYEYEGSPGNAPGVDYYPTYRPYNPVVERNQYGQGGYAPDGTYHGEDIVEDRHSSYYSPGRNEAITRPRTTVESWNYGPAMNNTRERTTWIGSDGRPHSTTIDRNTQMDPWGNTRTDTHIDLKRRPGGNPFQGQPATGYSAPGPSGRGQQYQPQDVLQRRVVPQPLVPMAPPRDEPIKLMPKPSTRQASPQAPATTTPSAPSTQIENPPASAVPEASR